MSNLVDMDEAVEHETVTAEERVEGGQEEPFEGTAPPSTTNLAEEGQAPAASEAEVDWASRVAEWGGAEEVEAALAIYRSLESEDGLTRLWIEAGRSLGMSIDQMQALISGNTPSEAQSSYSEEDPDLDVPLTKREVLELLQKEVLLPQAEAQQRAAAEAHAEHVRGVIVSTLDSLGVEDDDDIRKAVLTISNEFLPANREPTDADIQRAIKQGYDRFTEKVSAKAQALIQQKQQVRDSNPTILAGGGGGAGEPSNDLTFEKYGSSVLDEAIKRARKDLLGA